MKRFPAAAWCVLLCLAAAPASMADEDLLDKDLLIADFEGEDYGDWVATGVAFGSGPARGTLPSQMAVTGYEGEGLVNSFNRGDESIGELRSPAFTIERPYLHFLIGGGRHPGEACIDLYVEGKAARTATGPNDKPGGSERLDWHTWDLSEFTGKQAMIFIVDRRKGSWGHINIDHIFQSGRPSPLVETVEDIEIAHPYILFQVPPHRGPTTGVTLEAAGKIVRRFEAKKGKEPCWISWDVAMLKGESAALRTAELPAADGGCTIRETLKLADWPRGTLWVVDRPYRETYRPQFHFTARKNWLNDPNGLMVYKGEYHLFFQHNPEGINWGNMTWGHAVSPDLVHWTQLDHAIHPDALGTIFSGSGVVDRKNTAGFQTGEEEVLVCIYTSAGAHAEPKVPFTQSIAYSNDRGRTWTKYDGNPVLGHIVGGNRDPKVFWHDPSEQWVMALYLNGSDFALFRSPDLKAWTKLCDIALPGSGECPDLFELPVDGDIWNTRWIFWAGNGRYLLGDFDGRTFHIKSRAQRSHFGANAYAAQTFSNIPDSDGRRVQIAWMRGGRYPEMPFNQQMTFPTSLTLRTAGGAVRLFQEPVKEIEKLHTENFRAVNLPIEPGKNPLDHLTGDLFHIIAEIEIGKNEPGEAREVGFVLRGEKVKYDVAAGELTCLGHRAPLPPENGRIRIEILLDRTSIEIFGNSGRIYMPSCFLPPPDNNRIELYAVGGSAKALQVDVYKLKSAWGKVEDKER